MAWCTLCCPAKSARWKLPATCPVVPWSMPWKSCGGCPAAAGFGKSRRRQGNAGDHAAVYPANLGSCRRPRCHPSAAGDCCEAEEIDSRADSKGTEVESGSGEVVDRRDRRQLANALGTRREWNRDPAL